jgi:hypothetical protein
LDLLHQLAVVEVVLAVNPVTQADQVVVQAHTLVVVALQHPQVKVTMVVQVHLAHPHLILVLVAVAEPEQQVLMAPLAVEELEVQDYHLV